MHHRAQNDYGGLRFPVSSPPTLHAAHLNISRFSIPENATNPLSEYMDSSPDVTFVKSTTITERLAKDGAVEGSNIPFTPEDDNSD
jgi:hypothetical protein